jgi:hypothetical protein
MGFVLAKSSEEVWAVAGQVTAVAIVLGVLMLLFEYLTGKVFPPSQQPAASGAPIRKKWE